MPNNRRVFFKSGSPPLDIPDSQQALVVSAGKSHHLRMSHPYARVSYEDLAQFPVSELNKVMANGATPLTEELAGYEFRGFNPPAHMKALGIQKFIKGFFQDAKGLGGYNTFVQSPRSGLKGPWESKGKRHGFYDVLPISRGARYDEFTNAVLLDYGSGRNASLDPESAIRDYLVQVDPGNPELYLGKAYLDLGAFRFFSNFFIIERFRRA